MLIPLHDFSPSPLLFSRWGWFHSAEIFDPQLFILFVLVFWVATLVFLSLYLFGERIVEIILLVHRFYCSISLGCIRNDYLVQLIALNLRDAALHVVDNELLLLVVSVRVLVIESITAHFLKVVLSERGWCVWLVLKWKWSSWRLLRLLQRVVLGVQR